KSPDFPTYLGPYTSPASNITQYSDGFITKIDSSGTGLLYSGYLGGTSTDLVNSIAVDSSGRAYVCGTTESSDFPTKTGPDTTYNGQKDAFVTRVAASGASLDWSGFIGGTNDDVGSWIALDSAGNAYLTGYTASTQGNQFPLKNGPSLTHKGGLDAFVAKVSATGSSLLYCGFIGGSSDDYGAGIAVDQDGCGYLTGATTSASGFPVVNGPDTSYNGGADAFVAKVNPTGTGLVYCGFLGGSSNDFGLSIAVDAQGLAYVAGSTESSNFPVAGGPYSSYSGNRDAFVTVIKPDGLGFYYSSYLGGSDLEEANGVVADGRGNWYLAGFTRSQNFPVLVGPFIQPGGGIGLLTEDAFVTRIYGLIPPLPPTDLRMTGLSQNSVNLAWNDQSTNEDGFK
ncbi:MAG: SBBP repeat-containing protein, partial [Candidatus Saccharicenans sp.]